MKTKKDANAEKPLRDSAPSSSEVAAVRDESELELSPLMIRTGHYKRARELVIKSGMWSLEAVAKMTDEQIVRCVELLYKVVGVADLKGDDILLVPRAHAAELLSQLTVLAR